MRIRSLVFGLTVACAAPSFAQNPTARAQTLAGEFSKFKNETRTKKGVSHTKYKEVVAEAWVAPASAYAGHYLANDPIHLDIIVDTSGRINGSGHDHGRFELRDLAISGGLITGMKGYADGRSEKFEAVFLKRSTRDSASAPYSMHYGIGMRAVLSHIGYGDDLRIFAERQ